MDYRALGGRVAMRRNNKGWTQKKLAQELDLTASFIGHIERGTRKASLETLIKLCETLEMSPNELLADTIKSFPFWRTITEVYEAVDVITAFVSSCEVHLTSESESPLH